MFLNKGLVGSRLLQAVLATSLVFSPMAASHAFSQVAAAQGQDAKIQDDVNHQLRNKRYQGIKSSVQNGVVTLTGTVSNLADKLEAVKQIQKIKPPVRLDNQVEVTGVAEVSDQQLAQKLANKLTMNPTNPDRTVFEYVGTQVQNGVVNLTGFVIYPQDKDDIEGIVANEKGVKDLVDHIQVAPPSPNDDRIRRDVYRAIYGYSTFTRYAIDPAKTIRILVLNGNVTLVGVVDSQSDKEQANIRANGVGGVFKVTNDLQVRGTQNEK